MRLKKARVQNFRSVRDTGWFEVENGKTILVGINEAGKTILLQALQQINPPATIPKFVPLRDYPRAKYNDISAGKVKPADVTIVTAHFALEPDDKKDLPDGFQDCVYVRERKLDNTASNRLENVPQVSTFGELINDLSNLSTRIDARVPNPAEGTVREIPSERLKAVTKDWSDAVQIDGDKAEKLAAWLVSVLPYVGQGNADEQGRYEKLTRAVMAGDDYKAAQELLDKRVPLFVLFNNYFRVRPLIHLEHLAQRLEGNLLDDKQYDYGNQCLLKLLGFTARELSNLGKVAEPLPGDFAALQHYRDQRDQRSYQLNAASIRLTDEIRSVWRPDVSRGEADQLRLQADAQYLKVVVVDELGVDIELDQRSEGFQWLVSFFVVFFAEAEGKHKDAILLLDEPGLSLHGLKQREFRDTISRLAKSNQTLYTTHSPFLVGPNELDLVRVVEMTDRKQGTLVHTTLAADDAASLLPLQEALGYDLAQSLFAQERNLVLEGLTDYWYVEATAQLLREAGVADLSEKIALVPAASAGKVVYYATILHAQKLKVAALLDSDAAGDHAAQQDILVHMLGNKRILRTKDAYRGTVTKPEIEELLRYTLISVAKADLQWDVRSFAINEPSRPIVNIFAGEIADFSKYRLAKAYVRWTRNHVANELTQVEREQWIALIAKMNSALQ